MPKVSIIVPCFNHGKYLEQRLDSILNQTVTDIEVLILDDCSTDNSWETVQSYAANPKVSYTHRNLVNSGSPFIQWQKGIEKSKGKYIWLAESDDFATSDFLEKHLAVLDLDASIGISFCPSNWVDMHGNLLEIHDYESSPFIKEGKELIVEEFTKGCLIYNASSAVFRKKLVQNIDFKLINSYKFTGDWLFWVQLIANTKVNRLPFRLNFFRRHNENVSTKSNKLGLQFSEGFRVVNYIFSKYTLGFFEKRKIHIVWAMKVSKNQDIEKKAALDLLPFEVKFWYFLLPIIHLLKRKI